MVDWDETRADLIDVATPDPAQFAHAAERATDDTRDRQYVPLATCYDKHERIANRPQPFLFQRTIGQRTEVVAPGRTPRRPPGSGGKPGIKR
jgi:hypothetical protein